MWQTKLSLDVSSVFLVEGTTSGCESLIQKKKDIKVTFILWLQIYPSLFLKIKEAKILDKFIIEEQLHSVVGRFKFSFLPIIKYL